MIIFIFCGPCTYLYCFLLCLSSNENETAIARLVLDLDIIGYFLVLFYFMAANSFGGVPVVYIV